MHATALVKFKQGNEESHIFIFVPQRPLNCSSNLQKQKEGGIFLFGFFIINYFVLLPLSIEKSCVTSKKKKKRLRNHRKGQRKGREATERQYKCTDTQYKSVSSGENFIKTVDEVKETFTKIVK